MTKISTSHQKWWILVAMASGIAMIFVDQTVLPVALPSIQRELQLTEKELQWIVNSYLLVLSVLLMAGGRIADIIGHRRGFCIGLAIFSLASALCGLSFNGWWFILARALQGVGGAMLIPVTGAILVEAFPYEQRGKALGLYVGIGSVFLALGPTIGGFFTEFLSWRYVFWINLPIAAFGVILTLIFVQKSTPKKQAFDLLGFFSLLIGISCLIVALMEAPAWGWSSISILSLLSMGGLFLILLVFVERKVSNPLIDFSLLSKRVCLSACLAIFINQLLLTVCIFWMLYFQEILNYSPSQTGTLSLISNIPMIATAPLAGHLVDRYGPKIPTIIGFGFLFLSLIWLSLHPTPQTLWQLVPTLLFLGFGVPLVFTPSFTSSMNAVTPEQRGLLNGFNSTARQFAGALGMAGIGGIYLNFHLHRFGRELSQHNDTQELVPEVFEGLFSHVASAKEALDKLPMHVADLVSATLRDSYVEAFALINFIAALLALLGMLVVYFLLKPKITSH